MDGEGKPIPVGPEILQKHDEAVKRFNENKAQAQAKPAPRGGVGVAASMIVLEPEEASDTSASCAAVDISEDYYAMMDSGASAIIVPLHPDTFGEIAECRLPSSIVQGPIVHVLDYLWRTSVSGCASAISHSYFTGVANHCRWLDSHS